MGESALKEPHAAASRHQPEAPEGETGERQRGPEQKINQEIFTPGQIQTPGQLPKASGEKSETPGYPMPGLRLTQETRPESPQTKEAGVKPGDRIEKPRLPQVNPDGTVPLEAIAPKDAAQYLSPDGKGLPPIARDFKQIGMNALKAKEANDALKPQIHVSKVPGDARFARGSAQNPYSSIQDAVDAARPGTVINVHKNGSDSYNERVNIAKSDIVLTTDPKNPAVLDLKNERGKTAGGAFTIGSGMHDIDIKNFEIKNFSGQQAAIKVEGDSIKNINIAGNNIHSANLAEGIRIYGTGGSESSKLTNINILGNEISRLTLGELEAMPINGNIDGFRVIGNAGHDLNNIFIDAIGGEGKSPVPKFDQARNGQIEFNYAKNISTKENSSYSSYSSAAIYSDGARDLSIRNNYIVGADFGIEVGSEHRGLNSTNVRVTGNVVQDSGFVWLGRGGDGKRPGGASDSFAKNNIVIGNDKDETQLNVTNFAIRNNPSMRTVTEVNQLPQAIAVLARHNANRQR